MLKVLAAATFHERDLASFALPPDWRKATRNMILATASMQRALERVPGLNVTGDDQVGFVLGSVAGELETTGDFLATWAKMRMARPVLFQNSLHNATTGFASIHFKLTGPSFTVSSDERTPSECVRMAQSLLQAGLCQVCLVTVIEAHKSMAAAAGIEPLPEGACTLIVANAKGTGTVQDKPTLSANGKFPLTLSEDIISSFDYVPAGLHKPLIDITAGGLYAAIENWECHP